MDQLQRSYVLPEQSSHVMSEGVMKDLLSKQHELLSKQNDLLDRQNHEPGELTMRDKQVCCRAVKQTREQPCRMATRPVRGHLATQCVLMQRDDEAAVDKLRSECVPLFYIRVIAEIPSTLPSLPRRRG